MLGPSPEARSPSLEGSDVEGVVDGQGPERACNQQTGGLVILVLAEEHITSGSADHGVPVARGPAPRRERQNSGRPSNRCPNAPSRPNAMLHLANHPFTVASRLPTLSVVHLLFFCPFSRTTASSQPATPPSLLSAQATRRSCFQASTKQCLPTARPPRGRNRADFHTSRVALLRLPFYTTDNPIHLPTLDENLPSAPPNRSVKPIHHAHHIRPLTNQTLHSSACRLDSTRLD